MHSLSILLPNNRLFNPESRSFSMRQAASNLIPSLKHVQCVLGFHCIRTNRINGSVNQCNEIISAFSNGLHTWTWWGAYYHVHLLPNKRVNSIGRDTCTMWVFLLLIVTEHPFSTHQMLKSSNLRFVLAPSSIRRLLWSQMHGTGAMCWAHMQP